MLIFRVDNVSHVVIKLSGSVASSVAGFYRLLRVVAALGKHLQTELNKKGLSMYLCIHIALLFEVQKLWIC